MPYLLKLLEKNSAYIPRREAGIEQARELPLIVQIKAYDGHGKGHGPEIVLLCISPALGVECNK